VLVDSHCHLNYLDDPHARLTAARLAGVSGFLCIGVNEATQPAVLAIAEQHADVWASAGVHPESVGTATGLDWLELALRHPRVVGVGETGLDYFAATGNDELRCAQQRESFASHLALGAAEGLPVIVHTRGAETDTADLLRAHPECTGVLHCFTESWDLARCALDLGWYVSISGIVTFRNAENVRAVARQIPDDRLLIETDAPWLAPVPHRGKRNEPAWVTHTAACLAELRGQELAHLAEQTTANFARLFSTTALQPR
jgi:TatD DNase family protein